MGRVASSRLRLSLIAVLWMGLYGFGVIAPYCFFLGLCIPLACCYYGDRVVGCAEITASGAPTILRCHFSAMTWPRWLRRAARNRHRPRHRAASRRWREGHGRFRTNARKILISTRWSGSRKQVDLHWIPIEIQNEPAPARDVETRRGRSGIRRAPVVTRLPSEQSLTSARLRRRVVPGVRSWSSCLCARATR